MNKSILILACTLFLSLTISAQNIVKGTVTDENNNPIPSATVLEKNTKNGTTTDFNGKFELKVSDNAIIVISYLGYKDKEVIYTGQKELFISLEPDVAQLEEVVIIGYGSVKRDKITTSISTVKGTELAKQVASNPAEALQGKAAGVQVLSSGGNPGASPQILIRGITTGNSNTAPLIVLDGVMLPTGTSLNFLNPADIESFQILKDASASAIYGSRASNGVVLITSKRGKIGKTKISVDLSTGIQRLEKIEMADANEYIQVINQRRTNDGNQPLYDPANITSDTDWWDQTIEDFAPITNANISISGGSEKMNYANSISFFDQQSNYTKGWYQRVTGRFNFDFKISDKVSISQDLSPRIEKYENTPGLLYNLLRIDPLTEVYLPQNQRTGNIFSIYSPSNNLVPNPVGVVARQFNETQFFGFFSNTKLNYKITPELTFTSQFGLNISSSRTDAFAPTYFTNPNQQREINTVYRNTSQRFDYVVNNTVTFEKTIAEKHYLNFLGGVLHDAQNFNYLNASRDGVPSDEDPLLRYLDAATGERIVANSNESQKNIFSGIFRAIYSYDNKYTFNASVRADSSSIFPENNKTGYFSSISFSWDIDSENWFKSETINNLRLKVGTGEVGNDNIPLNARFFQIGDGNFGFNGDRTPTNFLSAFGNTRLKWETVRDQNIGLDIALWNNEFTFSIEAYKKISEDLLFSVELPNYTGVPGTVWQNVGSFESQGIDLQLGYNKNIGDLTLGLNLTLSTNESKAVSLSPGNEQILGQKREDLGNRFIKITELGETVGLFQGYKTMGIFQNQTEINSHSSENGTILQPNAKPGDLIFQDINNDGVINDEDMTIIGNPFADFYGGFNANIQYKKWYLSMQWYGTFGNDVFNYPSTFLNSGIQDVNVAAGTINRVWTPNNTNAIYPRLTQQDRNGNYQRPSDLFIEDASYLRLRNIQLGYDFNIPGFQKCRFFVSGQNLLTLTNYSGFDPEVAAGGNVINGFGVDYARNPVAKTFLLGLNLSL